MCMILTGKKGPWYIKPCYSQLCGALRLLIPFHICLHQLLPTGNLLNRQLGNNNIHFVKKRSNQLKTFFPDWSVFCWYDVIICYKNIQIHVLLLIINSIHNDPDKATSVHTSIFFCCPVQSCEGGGAYPSCHRGRRARATQWIVC